MKTKTKIEIIKWSELISTIIEGASRKVIFAWCLIGFLFVITELNIVDVINMQAMRLTIVMLCFWIVLPYVKLIMTWWERSILRKHLNEN